MIYCFLGPTVKIIWHGFHWHGYHWKEKSWSVIFSFVAFCSSYLCLENLPLGLLFLDIVHCFQDLKEERLSPSKCLHFISLDKNWVKQHSGFPWRQLVAICSWCGVLSAVRTKMFPATSCEGGGNTLMGYQFLGTKFRLIRHPFPFQRALILNSKGLVYIKLFNILTKLKQMRQ